jgi:hypothetical protein
MKKIIKRARERQEAFGKIWGPFSSEETVTLLKGIFPGQLAAE